MVHKRHDGAYEHKRHEVSLNTRQFCTINCKIICQTKSDVCY